MKCLQAENTMLTPRLRWHGETITINDRHNSKFLLLVYPLHFLAVRKIQRKFLRVVSKPDNACWA